MSVYEMRLTNIRQSHVLATCLHGGPTVSGSRQPAPLAANKIAHLTKGLTNVVALEAASSARLPLPVRRE